MRVPPADMVAICGGGVEGAARAVGTALAGGSVFLGDVLHEESASPFSGLVHTAGTQLGTPRRRMCSELPLNAKAIDPPLKSMAILLTMALMGPGTLCVARTGWPGPHIMTLRGGASTLRFSRNSFSLRSRQARLSLMRV